jgi:hypothetical protein
MSFTGDIGQVGQLAERIGDLANVPARVAARVSEELELELQADFAAGTDPYGDPWAPLAPATEARGGTAAPLTPGSMLDSLRVAPLSGAGVGIALAHPAEIHQKGWTGPRGSGPARPMVPDRDTLPEKWREILGAATEDEIQEALK